MNDFKEGFIEVDGGKVYYCGVGTRGNTPLLAVHGGPGFSHITLRGLDGLSNDRPIFYYDQLGSGKSERPDDVSLWKIDRFVRELESVRKALHLDEVILFGSSWGTTLIVEYLMQNQKGVKGVILAHPCLSVSMWEADTRDLLKQLPTHFQKAILKHETAGTTDSEEYQHAFKAFMKQFICRLDPEPEILKEAFQAANLSIYMTMWGPSEWAPTGNLKGYERVSDLKKIKAPTLFLCGEYDEATPRTTKVYHEHLPGSKCAVIPDSSHLAILEQPQTYLRELRKFLRESSL